MLHPLLSWSEPSTLPFVPPPPRGHRSAARLLLDLRNVDAATFRHVRDAARLTVAIARDLGLSSEDREHLAHAALLHDSGKLFVDPALLKTTERLDAADVEEIRAHPETGYEYAQRMPELRAACDVIRHHHERWDGRGYPDRLAGTDIPWDARIVAVADAAEAMLAGRSYRPPRSTAETIAELRRCSGTQFDPWVARHAAEGSCTRRVLLKLEEERVEPAKRHEPPGIGERTDSY